MSQEKVDRYKEEKRNRKATIKKEKRKLLLEKAIWTTVGIAVIIWGIYSVYDMHKNSQPVKTKEFVIDSSPLNDYFDELSEEGTEEEPAEEISEETEVLEESDLEETEVAEETEEPVEEVTE